MRKFLFLLFIFLILVLSLTSIVRVFSERKIQINEVITSQNGIILNLLFINKFLNIDKRKIQSLWLTYPSFKPIKLRYLLISPAFSPDGANLVFTSDFQTIYLLDLNTMERKKIGSFPLVRKFRWSPSGKKIGFVWHYKGLNTYLVTLDVRTRRYFKIAKNVNDLCWCWGKGECIYYIKEKNGEDCLYRRCENKEDLIIKFNEPIFLIVPSHKKDKMVLLSGKKYSKLWLIYNLDKEIKKKLILQEKKDTIGNLIWASDDICIIFSLKSENEEKGISLSHLYIVNTLTGKKEQLTSGNINDAFVGMIEPDKIVFIRNDKKLCLMNLRTKRIKEIFKEIE